MARVCCDGQYQVQEFRQTLCKELGLPIDPLFSEIVWDPSHWTNLSILDIRDRKLGSSSSYLKRIVASAKNITETYK
jgi:hypothetical protein